MNKITILQKKQHNGRFTLRFETIEDFIAVTAKLNRWYMVDTGRDPKPPPMQYSQDERLEVTTPIWVNPYDYRMIIDALFPNQFDFVMQITLTRDVKYSLKKKA